ncbi:MAG: class I SAM-dependent methyltransferase [Candidatus Woesearchaeota archaeon]
MDNTIPDFMADSSQEKIPPHFELVDAFPGEILPYIGDYHIDYGCGRGLLLSMVGRIKPKNAFAGYDPDPERIRYARSHCKLPNISFFDSLESLSQDAGSHEGADSVTMAFLLQNEKSETNADLFKKVYSLLKFRKPLIVFDYHMIGKSPQEFDNIFTAETELAEIERLGHEAAFARYTSGGLDECVALGMRAGFLPIREDLMFDKYFMWIGIKS